MRSDYGLYGVAATCFVLAAVFGASLVPGYPLSTAQGVAVTVVFLLIGVIAAAVGYSAKPKSITPSQEPAPAPAPITPMTPIEEPTPVTEEPTTPPPPPIEEVSLTPEPMPEPAPPQPIEPLEPSPSATPAEESTPTEAVAEEKPKTTRRRRKKAVA